MRTVIRCYVFRRDSIPNIYIYIASDTFVYLALAALVSMAIVYSVVMGDIFEVDRVTAGHEKPAPGFLQRGNFFLRCQFALICLFWTSVWSVKVSILLFYKTLFNKLRSFQICWWLVLGFVVVTYLACWGTQLASCWPIPTYFNLGRSQYSMQTFFLTSAGSCDSRADTDRSNNSLYVTAAIDIFSDFLSKSPINIRCALLTSLGNDSAPRPPLRSPYRPQAEASRSSNLLPQPNRHHCRSNPSHRDSSFNRSRGSSLASFVVHDRRQRW